MKLNLGCGPHVKSGWVNCDIERHPGVEFADFSKAGCLQGLKSETVEVAHSEHLIEHLTYEQGQTFLKEVHRVLKKGGVLRISTPDLAMLARAYTKKDFSGYPAVWTPRNPCHGVNEGMRSWGHQFVYDKDTLVEALKSAGFSSVRIEKHGKSKVPALEGAEIRPFHGELILEAVK